MGDLIDFETEQRVRSPGYRTVEARAHILRTLPRADEDADTPVAELVARLLHAAEQLQTTA